MANGWLKRPANRNCTLFVWYDATGAVRSRSLGPAQLTDEQAWAAAGELGYTLLVGKPSPDHVRFGDLRRAYVTDGRTASGRPKAHSTLNTELRNTRLHLSHFDAKIAKDITSREVRDWLWKQSRGMQSKLRNTMSAIYRWARVSGLVPQDCDPVKDVGASALTNYEAVALTPLDTFRLLREIADPLVNTLVVVLAATALRASEVLGLRWSDLNFETGTIRIERGFVDGKLGDPKSRASRGTIQMHHALAEVFMDWRKQTSYAGAEDFVFASDRKKGKQPRLASMIVEDYIRPAAEKLGLRPKGCQRFGLHNLRHSLATWLVESGVKPIVVVRMLRWSDAKMIHTYAHLDRTAKGAQGKFMAKLFGGKRVQKRAQQKRPSRRKGA
jgi:integrase